MKHTVENGARIGVVGLLVAFGLVFAGCATTSYIPSKVNVRIVEDTCLGSDKFGICAVDGKVLEHVSHSYPVGVYVPPGHHEIEVRSYNGKFGVWLIEKLSADKLDRTLGFDCESGKNYTVGCGFYFPNTRGARGALRAFWIEDCETGCVVSGERPRNYSGGVIKSQMPTSTTDRTVPPEAPASGVQ